jgi:rRNA maturation protein Nop10
VIDFVGRLFQLSPYKAVEKLKEDFGMALADGKVRLAPRSPSGSSCWTITAVCSVGGSDTHRSHPQKNFTPASLKR